jgi:hypothetical protein
MTRSSQLFCERILDAINERSFLEQGLRFVSKRGGDYGIRNSSKCAQSPVAERERAKVDEIAKG